MIGLLWFILGNMWMFDSNSPGCPQHDVRVLAFSMIIINCTVPEHCRRRLPPALPCARFTRLLTLRPRLQTSDSTIFLPCLLVMLLVPVSIFCLPSFMRLLARFDITLEPTDETASTRMSDGAIEELGTTKYAEEDVVDTVCTICLSDFEVQEELRVLPCGHAFHCDCVDQWLTLHGNCPNCRKDLQV